MMVLEQVFMRAQKQRVFPCAHAHRAPRVDDFGACPFGFPDRVQRAGMGKNTRCRLGRNACKKIQHLLMFLLNYDGFGFAAQPFQTGPIGPAIQKGDHFFIAAAPLAKAVPFDHVQSNRPVAFRQKTGVSPIAAAHCIHRLPQGARALRDGGKSHAKDEYYSDQFSCHVLHFRPCQG